MEPIPATTFTEAQLDLDTLDEATLVDLLVRLDQNGDGVLDGADVAALAQCVEQGGDACDLDGNGEATADDVRLARLWIGERYARPERLVAALVEGLEVFARGDSALSADPNVLALLSDYDNSGAVDLADVQLLAETLSGQPAARFDGTGDGLLALDDVWVMAEVLGNAYFGEPLTLTDVTGDGVFDDMDLTLVTATSMLATHQQIGFLDANFDGRVDVLDFCKRTEHTTQPNFLRGVAPDSVADAAFAASTPTLLLCRTDGRSLLRFPARSNSDLSWEVRPGNLYAQALTDTTALPAGYEALDLAAVQQASEAYVLTQTPTDRRLAAMRMPWRLTDLGAPAVMQVRLDGPDPASGSVLLLPHAVAALTITSEQGALGEVRQSTWGYFTPDEQVDRIRLQTELSRVTAAYTAVIEQCGGLPWSSEQWARGLNFLLAYDQVLAEMERYAQARLEDLYSQHMSNLDATVALMNASAIGWNRLNSHLQAQWLADTFFLVVDSAKEGSLPGALATAASNLVGELTSEDSLPVYLTGEGTVLADATDGLVKSRTLDTVKGTLVDGDEAVLAGKWLRDNPDASLRDVYAKLYQGAQGVPAKDALGIGLNNLWDNTKEALPVQGTDWKNLKLNTELAGNVAFDMLKNLPKTAVNYYIRSLLEAGAQAAIAASAYASTAPRVDVWSQAVADLGQTRAAVQSLTQSYRAAAASALDPTASACADALEAELTRIESAFRLDEDTAAAFESLKTIRQSPVFSETALVGTCFHGDTRRALEAAQLRGAAAAMTLATALAAGDEGLMAGALNEADAARQAQATAQAAYDAECAASIEELGMPGKYLLDFRAALDTITAARAVAATEADAAWATYKTCAGPGALAFSLDDLAGVSVWASAAAPLAQAPSLPSCLFITWNADGTPSPLDQEGSGAQGSLVTFHVRGFDNALDHRYVFLDPVGGTRLLATLRELALSGDLHTLTIAVPAGIDAATEWLLFVEQGADADLVQSNPLAFRLAPQGKIAVGQRGSGLFLVDPYDATQSPIEIVPWADAYPLDHAPAWSYDMTRLVYARAGSLQIVGAAGNSQLTIPTGAEGQYPRFSRSGRKLVFVDTSNFGEIWTRDLISPDAPSERILTTLWTGTWNPRHWPEAPVFSPDGSRVAAAVREFTENDMDPGEVILMDTTGLNQGIVNVSAEGYPPVYDWGFRIYWTLAGEVLYPDHPLGKVVAYDVSTEARRELPPTSGQIVHWYADAYTYALSPNEQLLAYRDGTTDENDIRIVGIDGSNDRLLVDLPSSTGLCIAFSPDNREVAYLLDSDVYAVDVETGTTRLVYDGDPNLEAECLAWYP